MKFFRDVNEREHMENMDGNKWQETGEKEANGRTEIQEIEKHLQYMVRADVREDISRIE
jgi:hypothetical protein